MGVQAGRVPVWIEKPQLVQLATYMPIPTADTSSNAYILFTSLYRIFSGQFRKTWSVSIMANHSMDPYPSPTLPPSPSRTPEKARGKKARISDTGQATGSSPSPVTRHSLRQRERRSRTASTGSTPIEARSSTEQVREDTQLADTAGSPPAPTRQERRSSQIRPQIQPGPASAPAELPQTRNQPASLRRPDGPTKAHSAPTQTGPSSTAARVVDGKIISILRRPLSKTQASSEIFGNNYVLEVVRNADKRKILVKVGYTKGEGKRRVKRIQDDCDHLSIKQQEDPEHVPIRLYQKAEALIKAELSAFEHKFHCECKVQHREYFDIEARVAREVSQRWRRFCRMEPYDNDGNLQPFWEHRIRNMRPRSKSEKASDHEMRAERWERFMNPTLFELASYDATSPIITLWRWRWHIITWFQSFTIAFITSPARWCLLVCALLTGWILVEMGGVHRPHTINILKRILRETGITSSALQDEEHQQEESFDTADQAVRESSVGENSEPESPGPIS